MSNLNDAILKAATAMLQKFNNRLNKNQRESESNLSDWASYLAIEKGYKVSQIGFALSELMKSGLTFMPSAYEIEAQLIPNEISIADKAAVIVSELMTFFRLHHHDLENKYIHTLSNDSLNILRSIQDSRIYRDSENFETSKAQLERFIKGVLASKTSNIKNESLERIGINTGKTLNFRTMDFSSYLPEVNK